MGNHGKLGGEITSRETADGPTITTNTLYHTYNDRLVNQSVSIPQPNGKVTTTNIINGKLLP
jgi:hypothetical protein